MIRQSFNWSVLICFKYEIHENQQLFNKLMNKYTVKQLQQPFTWCFWINCGLVAPSAGYKGNVNTSLHLKG